MASFNHPISFVKEAAPFVHLCWKMGWNEANGGNFSWRLPTEEVTGILARHYPDLHPGPAVPMPLDQPDLDGEYFLVTGSGQFFRHAVEHPEQPLSGEALPAAEAVSIVYPVLSYPEKVRAHDFGKEPLLEGTLVGVKGQYLILDTAVLNVRKFAGYHLEVD